MDERPDRGRVQFGADERGDVPRADLELDRVQGPDPDLLRDWGWQRERFQMIELGVAEMAQQRAALQRKPRVGSDQVNRPLAGRADRDRPGRPAGG